MEQKVILLVWFLTTQTLVAAEILQKVPLTDSFPLLQHL